MSEPLAYLLTWTCYGTWLHGDERGSVDRSQNAIGEPFLPSDPPRFATALAVLAHPPVKLDPSERRIAKDTIETHCRIRDWTLHAVNVRTNHVHVVVSCDIHPKAAMNQFKAWATTHLRANRRYAKPAQVWTEGGSRRWLWNAESLRQAIQYVMEFQGDDLD